MSLEQDKYYDYPEYDEVEVTTSNSTGGKRRPGPNERKQARLGRIELKRKKSDGNSNTAPGTDPLARTSRAGGRQPGIHGH